MIYLDNNASTRVDQRVLDAMLPWFRDSWANPSNTRHQEGRKALTAVTRAREQIGTLIRCDPDEVVLTSGASESNALAFLGVRPHGNALAGIVTSNIEHPSTYALALRLDLRGVPLTVVGPNARGFIASDRLQPSHIVEGTLVSLHWANSETGAINEIEAIAETVKAAGGLFHVDAAQALGKLPIDLSRCPIDLMTLSAHKVYGPKGIGALYVRKGVVLDPLIVGGRQENGRRAGTINVPGAVGFGAACAILSAEKAPECQKLGALRDSFESAVIAGCAGTVVVGADAPRVCNTSFLGWKGLDNRDILRALDEVGICAGAGSACSTESPFGSRILDALKIAPDIVQSCVRFSFGRDNTAAEAETTAKALIEIVADQRIL